VEIKDISEQCTVLSKVLAENKAGFVEYLTPNKLMETCGQNI
jgi:hypothetical protein